MILCFFPPYHYNYINMFLSIFICTLLILRLSCLSLNPAPSSSFCRVVCYSSSIWSNKALCLVLVRERASWFPVFTVTPLMRFGLHIMTRIVTVQLNPHCRNWRRMEGENWFNLDPVWFFFSFSDSNLFSVYIWELKASFVPSRKLLGIKVCTSVSSCTAKTKKQSLDNMQHTTQKHVVAFAPFDFYWIIWEIKRLPGKYMDLRRGITKSNTEILFLSRCLSIFLIYTCKLTTLTHIAT